MDLNRRIWQLSMGERQKVEIIKTLLRGASILIFDEPTSVLTPLETRGLFDFMKKFTINGGSIIFITHKLDEALAVSNRITVIRKGKVVETLLREQADKKVLTLMMFDFNSFANITNGYAEKTMTDPSPNNVPLLVVNNLTVENDNGIEAVKNVSLKLFSNEIVGIAGIAGNGQREFAEALAGLRKPKNGSIMILGRPLTQFKVKELRRIVGFIPEDPLLAVVPSLSIVENMLLTNTSGLMFFNTNSYEFLQLAEQAIKQLRIMAKSVKMKVGLMSGGNMQKIIVAREILRKPKILIAAYPTRGLDVSTSLKVRSMLKNLKNEGSGIILISEDLDELLELSDRIAVMSKGVIKGIVSPNEITKIAMLISN